MKYKYFYFVRLDGVTYGIVTGTNVSDPVAVRFLG